MDDKLTKKQLEENLAGFQQVFGMTGISGLDDFSGIVQVTESVINEPVKITTEKKLSTASEMNNNIGISKDKAQRSTKFQDKLKAEREKNKTKSRNL